MQALALLPEKIRQRRRIRQRVLDPASPREAFSNPKYGSTSRNFMFRVMATRKITPAPATVTPPYQQMQEESAEEAEEEEEKRGQLPVPTKLTDIQLDVYRQKPETPCQKIYQRACAKLHILPSTTVYEHLSCSELLLPHCGVGHNEVKAIAIALVHNSSVHTLNMADNRLGGTGTAFITEALRENRSLADLNLSNNALGTQGTRLVAGALLSNTSIVRVNLSGNNIQDGDVVIISEMLKKNRTLRDLNLSHNHVCHIGATLLGQALMVNTTLRTLDMSWNHLRLRGAMSFCYGVAMNEGLTRLYLAWNGLAVEGCCELGKALSSNVYLVELDVSANRINGQACRYLLTGLKTNTSLRCLRMGANPISTDCASSILLMVAEGHTGLTELDLTDVAVDTSFLAMVQKVNEKRPLAVRHGVPLRHDEITPGTRSVVLDTDDPVALLFEFMRQKNLRLIDLLHSLDKNHSDTLTRDELRNGLLNIDIPLSSRSMDILMKKLDLNRDGQVDYEELAIGLKEYSRKAARWRRREEKRSNQPVFSRLQQIRQAIRMRIEATHRRGST